MLNRYASVEFDDSSFQVHFRYWEPDEALHPPLVCLHPMPYSGAFYETFAPLVANGRPVVCPDYPGYGGSHALGDEPSIAAYAHAMWDALEGLERPMDLLGFHTGCLVGPEMTRQAPRQVRKLVLVDIPWFHKEARGALLEQTSAPPDFGPELESIESAYRINVGSRWGRVAPDRCFALLADQLRTGTRANEGFGAAFRYDPEPVYSQLEHPCLVIATDSSLNAPSHQAFEALPNAQLEDCPDIKAPAFEVGAEQIAAITTAFLDAEGTEQ